MAVAIAPETAIRIRQVANDDHRRMLSDDLLKEVIWPLVQSLQSFINKNPEVVEHGFQVQFNMQTRHARDKRHLTTGQVAERHGVSQQQVRRWCEQGLIDAERTPGGTWRIPADYVTIPLKRRRKLRDVKSVAGAWKDRPDLVRAALEQRKD